jgi:hypothetical protein
VADEVGVAAEIGESLLLLLGHVIVECIFDGVGGIGRAAPDAESPRITKRRRCS